MTSTSAWRTASSRSARGPQLRRAAGSRPGSRRCVLGVDLLGELGPAGPQHRRGVVGGERGDRRAPRAGADDRHLDVHGRGAYRGTAGAAPRSPRRMCCVDGPVLDHLHTKFARRRRAVDTAAVARPGQGVRTQAKLRLAPALTQPERGPRSPGEMAARVVRAAAPLPVAVVCDDDGVRAWAESVGAAGDLAPGPRAQRCGPGRRRRRSPREGVDRVVVAHADLPARHRARHGWPTATASRSFPTAATTAPTWSCVPAGCRVPVRLRTRLVRPPRGRGRAPRARRSRVVTGCLGWDVDVPTISAARPRGFDRRAFGRALSVISQDLAVAGPGPRHRRASRRHRVRLRRHAGQVGGRRMRGVATSSAPTGRRARGTPHADTVDAGRGPPGRAARGRARARRHRRGRVPRSGRRRARRRPEHRSPRWPAGSASCGPTSCSATTRGSATGSTPTIAPPASSTVDAHRRRP